MDDSLNLSDILNLDENEPVEMHDSLNLSVELSFPNVNATIYGNNSSITDLLITADNLPVSTNRVTNRDTSAIISLDDHANPVVTDTGDNSQKDEWVALIDSLEGCSSSGSEYFPDDKSFDSSSSSSEFPRTSTPQKRRKITIRKKTDKGIKPEINVRKRNHLAHRKRKSVWRETEIFETTKDLRKQDGALERMNTSENCDTKRATIQHAKKKKSKSFKNKGVQHERIDHGDNEVMRQAMTESAQETEREQAEIDEHQKRISGILQRNNMELKTVPKDGNCFLAATIAQVPSAELTAFELRGKLCDMMLQYKDDIFNFLTYDTEDHSKKETFFMNDVSDLRKDGTWNSDLADILPLIASNFFETPITIFSSSPDGESEINIASDDPADNKSERLFYVHWCIRGKEHYDYCIPKESNTGNQTTVNTIGTLVTELPEKDPNSLTDMPSAEEIESEQTTISRGRKRRRESSWQCNILKRKRNAGEEHFSRAGRRVNAKTIKPGCGIKCRHKCHANISELQRENIFHEFWQFGSATLRSQFIAQHISRCKRRRQSHKAKPDLSRKQNALEYSFEIDHCKVVVCKTFFLHTLDVSDKVVMNVLHNITAHGCLPSDRKGRHANHQQADIGSIQNVKNHIRSFPTVPSHYCRQHSQRQYFSGDLNLKEMYRLYIQDCQQKNIPPAKEHLYRSIFYKDFNISFHVPKKDVCSVCEKFRNSTADEQDEMRLDYERHQRNKIESRQLKKEHKERAQADTEFEAACFDLQQVLQCPSGANSLYFYRRKLDVFNLSVYSLSNGAATCYMWDETIAKRGSCEVASCVLQYLREKAAEGKTSIALYADNCGGQNKNRCFVSMMLYAVQTTTISKLAVVFLEKGHTQNENDSTHATIEHAKRRTEIFSPQQYFSLVRGAKKSGSPLRVVEVSQREVYDFKELCKSIRNTFKDENGESIKWREVRQFAVSSDKPKHVFFTYNHDEPYREFNIFGRSRQQHPNIGSLALTQMHNCQFPLAKAKYNDLQYLCKARAIPTFYHDFYTSLPYAATIANDSDGCQCSDVDEG